MSVTRIQALTHFVGPSAELIITHDWASGSFGDLYRFETGRSQLQLIETELSDSNAANSDNHRPACHGAAILQGEASLLSEEHRSLIRPLNSEIDRRYNAVARPLDCWNGIKYVFIV